MAKDLIPSSFWSFPSFRLPSIWSEEEDWLSGPGLSGLSVSEDDKNVYVEAAVPGVDPKDIEVTFDKGTLWIKGEAKKEEEDKKKKFYRKASSSFSYNVTVPGEIDMNAEPQATYKNGVMKVTFAKLPASQPRKITVKPE
ncbi:MAG: Hsp20/alpha crystallin family protein [Candidatus Omnitrophica bacterium]|nr:Hsp20/alpha crystallin family protein [Candidatus Omnitrophota bacterium]